jgi:hypothetical protein
MPRINEVAAIYIPGSDGEVPEITVAVFPKSGIDLKIIKSIDEKIDPLCYPIFFPLGSYGWSPNLKQTAGGNGNISRTQYVSYRLARRDQQGDREFNPLHFGGKLFHQYLVDQAVRIEKDRMDFVTLNQKKLCADKYVNVTKAIENSSKNNDANIGKRIILPSSVTGTPRWQFEQYQDAMAMITRLGKPDLFITITCNPEWKEIKDNLLPGQKSNDSPDLVARVFNIKKEMALGEIKNGIFGRKIGDIHVIEFQKRGLPHMHLLVTLHREDKLRYPADV